MNDLVPYNPYVDGCYPPEVVGDDVSVSLEQVNLGLPLLVVVKGLARKDREFHPLQVGDNLARILMDLSPDRWGGGGISIYRNCLSRHTKVDMDTVPDIVVAQYDLFIAYVGAADPITAGIIAAVVIGGGAGIIGGIGVGLAVGAIVLGGVAVGMFLFEQPKISTPESPGDQGSGRGTLGIPRNQARLGSRIPDIFGYMRTWPDLVAPAVDYYNGRDFTVDILYCVGIGFYDFGQCRFGDTDIARFPGTTVTQISGTQIPYSFGNLFSAEESSGFKLEINDADVVSTFSPWVELPGANTRQIWVDIVFPGGLIQYQTGGDTESQSVTLVAQYRRVLSPGPPPVYTAVVEHEWVKTANLTGSLRYTEIIPPGGGNLTAGTYEVRVRKKARQGSADNIHQHDCEIARVASFRASILSHKLFPIDRTYLQVHIQSSRQTGAQAFEDFNVLCSRRTLILQPNTYDPPAALRRWCDALMFMLTDPFTGGYTFDEVDRNALLTVQTQANSVAGGIDGQFNHIYDRFLDVDEQLQSCANALRSSVVQDYGVVTVVRDTAKNVSALITPQNRAISDEGSKTLTFLSPDENDGVEVEWFDSDNDFIKRIYRYPSNKTLYNPRKVEIVGLTNWSQVWRRAKYESLKQSRRRRTNTITTFEEGLLLLPMDLIEVVEMWDTVRTSEVTDYGSIAGKVYLDIVPKLDVNPNDTLVVSAGDGRSVDTVSIIDTPTSANVNRIFIARALAFNPGIVGQTYPGLQGDLQVGSRVAVYTTFRHDLNRWLVGTIKPGDGKCTITLIEYDTEIYRSDTDALPANPAPR